MCDPEEQDEGVDSLFTHESSRGWMTVPQKVSTQNVELLCHALANTRMGKDLTSQGISPFDFDSFGGKQVEKYWGFFVYGYDIFLYVCSSCSLSVLMNL